ncbi:C10 family peptidase [Duncaniella muris]|uniref:C10 family peptidase n=1 Tax=Duncaniella muris TaxID=2094150 RepID=UPI00271554C3|nr:C10 family peptidase [Duncaniella muris]
MRKSFLFISLAAVMAAPVASARTLSPSEALDRATAEAVMPVSRSGGSPELVMTLGSDEAPAIYVFNRSDKGYMILSADDVAAPVIGYSDNGRLDPDNLPENLRFWLELNKEQILRASAEGHAPYSRAAIPDHEPIGPLMTTMWNQEGPYNDLCPMIGSARTVTGCVATAMAEVMKYHNWPDKAAEDAMISYQWHNGTSVVTLSEDFSNYEFQWDLMIDDYRDSHTKEQANAVAKLMQACGYSVSMSYGTSASGSFGAKVGGALVNYFKYDAGLHNEPREMYSSAAWDNMIYENLKTCGPVLWWGSGSVGHCFVCDGYRGDGFYHFNWGWGGLSDGYYLLDALNPGSTGVGGGTGGFNNGQGVLLGVKPAGNDSSAKRRYTFYASQGITETFVSGSLLSMFGTFSNLSPYMVNATFKFRIFAEVNGEEKYLTSCTASIPSAGTEFYPPYYESMIECNIPESLEDGTYHIYPAVEFDGEEHVFASAPGYPDYVIYTREGGVNKAELHQTASLEVENLCANVNNLIYNGKRFRVTGTAKFVGGVGDTERYIGVRLLSPSGEIIAYSTELNIKFSDEGCDFDFVSAGFNIAPGEYTLALQLGFETIATCPVTITDEIPEGEYQITAVEVVSAVDPQNLKFNITVKGISGLIDEYMTVKISRSITPLNTDSRVPVFVTGGQTAVISYTVSLPSYLVLPGQQHIVRAERQSGTSTVGKTASAYFILGDTSGIDGIGADTEVPAEYFNLQGMPVSGENLAPGIYIRRQGPEVTKILVK